MEYALTAQQWRRIKGFLPGKASQRLRRNCEGQPPVCGSGAVDGTQRCGWRALPKAYGDWHSVYVRFARWAKADRWNRLFEALSADADFEYVMVDSTIVRAHQHAGGGKARRGFRPLAVPTTVRLKVKQNQLVAGSSKSSLKLHSMCLYSILGDGLTQKAIDEAVRQTNEMGIAMITLP